MGKLLKIVLVLIAVLAVLTVAAFFGLRYMAVQPKVVAQVEGTQDVYTVSNGVVYFYLIRLDNGEAALIDTGLDGSGQLLRALTDKAGVAASDIQSVFITHGHNDHFNGVPAVPRAKVYAGAADVALLEGRIQKDGIGPLVLNTLFEITPVTPDERLRGREAISLADGSTLLAFPFPGHTPGHYLYFHQGVLYVGDAFNYTEGTFSYPPDFVTMDMPQAIRSIAGMEQILDQLDVVTVCTGHGGCTPPAQTDRLLDDFIASAKKSAGTQVMP